MQPKKHYFAHIPTIAIFIVFAMSAPLGVLLFILKSIDKNAEKEETAAAQAQADYRSDLGPALAQTAPRQETEPTYGHDVPTKEQKDAKERHKLLTTLCTIGGAVFLFAGFSTLFMDGADSMMEAFTAIAQMLGGGAALLTGLRMDRTRKLERLLDKIAGDRDNIPLDELRGRLTELCAGKPVYVMCQSGLRSYIACRILEANGHEAYNFAGGFRFYVAVTNDRALVERAMSCGMDK